MQPRTRIQELPILLKALVGDGEGWGSLYVKDMIEHHTGFKLPEQRREIIDFIARSNGTALKAKLGVGPKSYQAMIAYLINH